MFAGKLTLAKLKKKKKEQHPGVNLSVVIRLKELKEKKKTAEMNDGCKVNSHLNNNQKNFAYKDNPQSCSSFQSIYRK